VGRCLLWSDIPFNFARNPFYVSMFEVASIVGSGYKPPTYDELRGPILQNEKGRFHSEVAGASGFMAVHRMHSDVRWLD
jgi:hypothetical protein